MKNISVHYCNIHDVFHLQFGIGCVYLCQHQIVAMLLSIYKNEHDLFMQALICSLNDLHIYSQQNSKNDYQLCFGKILVRLSREELLYFLVVLWKQHEKLMESIVSMDQVSNESNYQYM